MTAQTAALSNRLAASVLLIKALGGSRNVAMLPNPDEAGGEVKWTDYLPETPVLAVAQTGLFQPTELAA